MHHVMSVIARGSVATSAAPLSRDKLQGLNVQSHSTSSVLFPTSRELVTVVSQLWTPRMWKYFGRLLYVADAIYTVN
jgi:hypothetical protein